MGDSSDPNSKIFSVRIVSLDYYMAPPVHGLDISYSSFQGGKVKEVPVIRIYGSTPAGQKTCLHVHGALPYLYVPCSDLSLQPDQEGGASTSVISLAMEKALKLKGNAGSKRQHVHGCSLVRAKKFYGYHSSEELFLKIYLYYPQDVSRAASLLLAGAVLDKILQAYESHIPYLLQFLVDYNLYGMGHLHVSKLKFRHPVPEAFSPRKATSTMSHVELKDHSGSMNADLGGDSYLASPIWISSTIPDEWTWQLHDQPDFLVDNNSLVVKRQSTCQLEGDAVVEDILNQLLISYVSLSQSHSEVKMVQSLIPIWEELERNGMHGPAFSMDPQKPLAEDVLRTLSHWPEMEQLLAELSVAVGQSSFSRQCFRSLTDKGNLMECGHSEDKAKEVLTSPEGNDALGSLSSGNSFSQKEEGEKTSKEQNGHMKQLSIAQCKKSRSSGQANMKAQDQYALGLLKWLASSQAAEEINSDDELVHQTILSPLLPAATIDKVLMKANADIENQSQKECQDILDSVEDVITEESGGKAYSETDNLSSHTLFNKTIHQVDSASDELNRFPLGGKSSPEIEYETSRHAASNLFGRKRKKSEWGCLPVSSNQIVNNTSITGSSNVNKTCNSGSKVCIGTPFHGKTEVYKCPNSLKGDIDIMDTYAEEPSILVGCSMRDLMRKKRCYRVEQPESRASQISEALFMEELKKETLMLREQRNDEQSRSFHVSSLTRPLLTNELEEYRGSHELDESGEDFVDNSNKSDFYHHGKFPPSSGNTNVLSENIPKDGQLCSSQLIYSDSVSGGIAAPHTRAVGRSSKLLRKFRKDCLAMDATGSSCQSSYQNGGETFKKNASNLDSDSKSCTSFKEVRGMPSEKLKDTGVSTGVAIQQPQIHIVRSQGEDARSPERVSSKLLAAGVKADQMELIGLTLSYKPPVIEWTDELGRNSVLSPSMAQEPKPEEKDELYDGVINDILPFFMKDDEEEKEVQNVSRTAEYGNHVEKIIGVPVHYRNDGSYLYLLTPVQSPPSEEHVKRWLSFDGRNTLRDGAAEATVSITSSNQFPGDMMQLHGSLCPISDSYLLDSGSKPESKAHLDQSNLYDQENCSKELELKNDELRKNLEENGKSLASKRSVLSQEISQLSGPDVKPKLTPLSQMGFRDPASVAGKQQLTTVSIEIQAGSRGDLRPDPRFDAIDIVTLAIQEDDDATVDSFMLLRSNTDENGPNHDGISNCNISVFCEEKQLFSHFMEIISLVDPDILIGWDIQGGSLGFLAERATYLGIALLNKISRTPFQTRMASRHPNKTEKAVPNDKVLNNNTVDSVPLEEAIIEDEWGRTHASGVHVGGRIVLNLWRLMRGEVKLNLYTLEAVAEAVLRKKIPGIPHNILAKWFSSGPGHARYRCMDYVLARAKLNLHIMNQHDMINRTSELARVFGIDFFSVLSRGSQYRVESMFLRLAHTQNYVAISPGNLQVAYQPAMECLPLVMEPESGFYADPVVVLDFQSLYPSMIIAYNLCFCTCLGKITPSMANILGVSSYSPDMNVLQSLKHEILLTPNGVMYVPSKVRKGVLPRLLEEILSTRIMVKQAMKKLSPSQQVLHRIFNARQLALKLIANVTYGYTAAGFSGRMPCAELADSIVQSGRRTLENAIFFVNNNDKWKAKVIYGDTDSMFVLLKGRSLQEAFRIGDEIASAISATNPNPVVLKMEKVYYPCFLLTKKRYVGYSYESPNQREPKFDAKGIETVRRDSCGAVSKTMEQSLRLYLEHQDIHKVKAYLLRQWTRIVSGRVSLEDFVFAKEVRLGTYSARSNSLPPAAIVATKAMRADPRAEPRYAERVPYVVVHGEPGARLVDMVVDPMELLAIDSPYRLNELYYIRKQIIPALQRVFGLVGADLIQWFSDMPRPEREAVGKRQLFASSHRRTRIDSYYLSKHCVLCGALVQAKTHVCHNCSRNEAAVALVLTGKTAKLEKDIQHLVAICRHCGGGDWLIESGVKCTSLACSIFYERRKTQKELKSLSTVAAEAGFYPRCMAEWF